MVSSNTRIPVFLGESCRVAAAAGGPEVAWLLESDSARPAGSLETFVVQPDHPSGCSCCQQRSGVAQALDRLYLRRVRGEVAGFASVRACCVTAAGEVAVRAALTEDVIVASRFRLG